MTSIITSKNFFTSLTILLLLTTFISASSIPNLQYQTFPGLIFITYNGAQPYKVGSLTLTFSLSEDISTNWGFPWVDWKLASHNGSVYEYTNQADLSNSALQPGQVITFQYSPTPLNSQTSPSQISLSTNITQPIIPSGEKLLVGYFQSWSEKWAGEGSQLTLANLPAYVNVVILSFVKPDCVYNGDLNLAGTGLQFSSSSQVVKAGIAALKAKNPSTKVLVAVGGATYTNWAGLNVKAIADVVKDFGLDGIDIDYEPSNPNCVTTNGEVKCNSDAELQNVVIAFRNALPSPLIVSAAAFSIGAYGGSGRYANSQPQSGNTGLFVNLLKSQYGAYIDLINIMSYDASDAFNPIEAYDAYKSYFKGAVVIGVEVPPEAWGGHVISLNEVASYTSYVNANDGAGMMIWSLQKAVTGDFSVTNPNAEMISQFVCKAFNLPNCNQRLGL